MKVAAYYTETSYVALDMLKGYLRVNDPVLFQSIEWSEPENGNGKYFFFFDSLSNLDKEKKRIESISAKSIPHLKVIMTDKEIEHEDPTVKAWSLEELHQFLLS